MSTTSIIIIAAGQSSTVTGTLAGQIVMEGYLQIRMNPWLRRIITRAVAVVPAYITILFAGENKMTELLIFSLLFHHLFHLVLMSCLLIPALFVI